MVGLIGIGTFIGAVLGTGVFPVFGSVLGGAMGSFVMAFVYEYSQTMDCDDAFELAWKAAKLLLPQRRWRFCLLSKSF